MRKKLIAGNWKMNKAPSETADLINSIKPVANGAKCEVVVCPTFVCLDAACEAAADSDIAVGAQNMYFEDKGAYTGEISANMLLDLGVTYVIIGHSERRQYFGETDEGVNKKTIKALEKGLIPIVCVGEVLQEREAGVTFDIIRNQVKKAFKDISAKAATNVVIAYEPVWAIGTGKTATNEQAEEVCADIRATISGLYDEDTANAVIIQYGGSVNAANAKELLHMPNIDGALVGGASLKADDFSVIIKAV